MIVSTQNQQQKSPKGRKEEHEMTQEEKKLLQAKHQLEEAQMRDRAKERKERTRRLIQEGAILEKVFPWANDIVDLAELEKKLYDISKRTADC